MDKKTIYILIVLAIVITAGVWLWMKPEISNAPSGTSQGTTVLGSDTTTSINQDLSNVTVQDPNFQNIDGDINSL